MRGLSAHDGQATAAREADRRQADHFREELHRQIGVLDTQMTVYESALAQYSKHNMMFQVRRIERELRFGTRVERPVLHYPMVAVVAAIVPTNLFLVLEQASPRAPSIADASGAIGPVVVEASADDVFDENRDERLDGRRTELFGGFGDPPGDQRSMGSVGVAGQSSQPRCDLVERRRRGIVCLGGRTAVATLGSGMSGGGRHQLCGRCLVGLG